MSGQGGYGQGGYPPGQQGGYPPGQQGGYPQGGYPPGGYPQNQPGQPGWHAQGQQPGSGNPYGYPPAPGHVQPGSSGPQPQKSGLLIVGIVIAAVVLLVALGGIFIALGSSGSSSPGAPITPDTSQPPAVPTSAPTSHSSSGHASSGASKAPTPSRSSTTGGGGGQSGTAIDLSHGIALTPASGWMTESRKSTLAVLTNGKEIFVGQVAELQKGADPQQVVDSYHHQLAKNYTNVTYTDATSVDLGSSKVKAAKGGMAGTAASGQGSSDVKIFSVASVRTTDGVTVVGTVYYSGSSEVSQINDDFSTMLTSMLKTQVAG